MRKIFVVIFVIIAFPIFADDPETDVIRILNEMQQSIEKLSNNQYDAIDIDHVDHKVNFIVHTNSNKYFITVDLNEYVSGESFSEVEIVTCIELNNNQILTQLLNHYSNGFKTVINSSFKEINIPNDMVSRTWIRGTSTYEITHLIHDNMLFISRNINLLGK